MTRLVSVRNRGRLWGSGPVGSWAAGTQCQRVSESETLETNRNSCPGVTVTHRSLVTALNHRGPVIEPAMEEPPLTRFPSLKIEGLDDDVLDRVVMSMTPTPHAAGYYEVDLNVDYDVGRCSVWLPVAKGDADALPSVGKYHYTVHWSKKMAALTQGWVCMPCLGSFDVSLPAGATKEVDPNKGSSCKPIGAVLIAHGLSGPRFEFAHVAEALAARGFVVMAPEFEDSGCNKRATVMEHGSRMVGQHTVLRMHQLSCCEDYLRRKFGAQLEFGLLGYSIGNAAVRHMRCDWPKVHIAGPSPVGKTAPLTPFWDADAQSSEAPTDAPCLVIVSHADSLAPSPVEAAQLAGHSDPTPLQLEHCTSGRLPHCTMHAFDTLPHPAFTMPELVAHDQNIMQKCSCFLACPSAEERRLSERAAKLLVPLLVRFFEQNVGTRLGMAAASRTLSGGLSGKWAFSTPAIAASASAGSPSTKEALASGSKSPSPEESPIAD